MPQKRRTRPLAPKHPAQIAAEVRRAKRAMPVGVLGMQAGVRIVVAVVAPSGQLWRTKEVELGMAIL